MAEHGAKVVISRAADVCDQVRKINDSSARAPRLRSPTFPARKFAEPGRRIQPRLRQDRRAGLQRRVEPYYGPLRHSDDQFRKILDNNIVANNWLISMVVPQMIDARTARS
jgi:hypothetical protein